MPPHATEAFSKPSLYAVMKQCRDRTSGSVTKRPISRVGATMRINCGSRRNLTWQKYAMTGIGPRNQWRLFLCRHKPVGQCPSEEVRRSQCIIAAGYENHPRPCLLDWDRCVGHFVRKAPEALLEISAI
jgi:hypothetical protein